MSCPLSVVGRRGADHLHASSGPVSRAGSMPSETTQRENSIWYQRAICHSVGAIGDQPGVKPLGAGPTATILRRPEECRRNNFPDSGGT